MASQSTLSTFLLASSNNKNIESQFDESKNYKQPQFVLLESGIQKQYFYLILKRLECNLWHVKANRNPRFFWPACDTTTMVIGTTAPVCEPSQFSVTCALKLLAFLTIIMVMSSRRPVFHLFSRHNQKEFLCWAQAQLLTLGMQKKIKEEEEDTWLDKNVLIRKILCWLLANLWKIGHFLSFPKGWNLMAWNGTVYFEKNAHYFIRIFMIKTAQILADSFSLHPVLLLQVFQKGYAWKGTI